MSAGPRHAAPSHEEGCGTAYNKIVADPNGEAVVTAVIPESGLLIEAGGNRFRAQATDAGIVFSALRAPRHAAPAVEATPSSESTVEALPWAERPADESVVLPKDQLVPVEVDDQNLMGVIAAPELGMLVVSATGRQQPVQVFSPRQHDA